MNSNTKALASLVAIILFLLIFHFVIHRPMSREYGRLQERKIELGRLLKQAQDKLLGLPRIKDEVQSARHQLELLDQIYPSSIAHVYRHITDAAQSTGVENISQSEEAFPREDLKGVERRLIRWKGRGSFRAVGEFLESLQRLPIRVAVSGLSLQRDGLAGPDVSFKLALEVYLKKEA